MHSFAIGSTLEIKDFCIVAFALFLTFTVIFPVLVLLRRAANSERAHHQRITAVYSLPLKLTPAEVSFIFSSVIKPRHIRATLLHLAERKCLILTKSEGIITAKTLPTEPSKLKPYECFLLNHIEKSGGELSVSRIVAGNTRYVTSSDVEMSGSVTHIFKRLLNESMQADGYFVQNGIPAFVKRLVELVILKSIIISVLSVVIFRFIEMSLQGRIKMPIILNSIESGLVYWLLGLPLLIIVCVFYLRFEGLMLGRSWLFGNNLKHYGSQIDAYREFVRLAENDKLTFVSTVIKKESLLKIKPFAYALGYIKRL